MRENLPVSELSQIIRSEIGTHGPISFARFMELALYHPGLGYYETDRQRVGFQGDFYTSVSTGELFGQLLAFRFAQWLEALPNAAGGLWLIEAGAHDGQLARDILSWLTDQRPELYNQLHYAIIDPSPLRQAWQREKLAEFGDRVRWFGHLSALAKTNGIIFSNELLDALPVHRLGWDKTRRVWFEWGVTVEGEHFAWMKITHDIGKLTSALKLPDELLNVLPDGYTIEVSPAADDWWQAAAACLVQGKLLAIDYGFTQEELISPARTNGTLRGYHQHQFSENVLAHPGAQDLTAHVNFSAVQSAGERAGLKTHVYATQPQFLTGILGDAIKAPSFGAWNARRTRQFQTLTHPQHLGRAFKVLIQGR